MRNKHAGDCYGCGGRVEAGAGYFERHDGGWRVRCVPCAARAHKAAGKPLSMAQKIALAVPERERDTWHRRDPMPPTCSTCGAKGALLWKSSADLYRGTDYGPVWVCHRYPECQSWVGCHPNTVNPLGTPAGPELRKARNAAHAAFDPLWRAKIAIANREIAEASGNKKKLAELRRAQMAVGGARRAAYAWLGRELGIPAGEVRARCHIAMFDEETCRRVVEICAPYIENLRRKKSEAISHHEHLAAR